MPIDDDRATRSCLADEHLLTLLDTAKTVQAHFGSHQDIEWALAGGELYVLQSRPVTTLAKKPDAPRGASAMDLIMQQFGVPGGTK